MSRAWIWALLLGAIGAPAGAAEKSGWYLEGKGGPAFEEATHFHAEGAPGTVPHGPARNVVGAFGMSAGYEWMYRFNLPVRTAIEFMNRTELTYNAIPAFSGNGDALASTVQNITVMPELYLHVPVDSGFWWPFMSAGVGWSHNTVKALYSAPGSAVSDQKHAGSHLAWSVGAGASFRLGPDMMNDVELRYVDLGRADWQLPTRPNLVADHVSSLELIFSLRYVF